MHTEEMGHALKIVRRMVNLNLGHLSIYTYEGRIIERMRDRFYSLWRFCSDKEQKHVTNLASSLSGSRAPQASGLVQCTSQDSSCPEFTRLWCRIFILNIIPCFVGYDGTVLVFDVRSKNNRPIYRSSVKDGKHTDPVFQVVWQRKIRPRS